MLDDDEQLAVLDTVLEVAPGLPVMVGLAGVMVPAPYYMRPSQPGCADHFTRLADASAVPLVLYDIPYRTGVDITLDTLLALAALPQHPGPQGLRWIARQNASADRRWAPGRAEW